MVVDDSLEIDVELDRVVLGALPNLVVSILNFSAKLNQLMVIVCKRKRSGVEFCCLSWGSICRR